MVNIPRDFLTIGDLSTLAYDAIITAKDVDAIPEKEVEVIEIPGRNGDMVIDHGTYKNVQISYTFFFADKNHARAFMADVATLSGYVRIEDSEYPDEYRMARLVNGDSVARLGWNHEKATVTLVFSCKPQRWLKSGEMAIKFVRTTSSTSSANRIFNPSTMAARPIFHVISHTGACQFYANNNKALFSVGEQAPELYVDMELLDAYLPNGTTANNYVGFYQDNLDAIKYGENSIFTNAPCEYEVIPRWWRL